ICLTNVTTLASRQGGYVGQANDTLRTRLTIKPVAEDPCTDIDAGRHLDDPRASPAMGLDDGRDAGDTISDRADGRMRGSYDDVAMRLDQQFRCRATGREIVHGDGVD